MTLRQLMPAKFSVIIFSAFFTLTLSLIAAAQDKIAFTSNRDGNNEIYIMNPDGSGQVRLTNHPGRDYAPSFSRHEGKIAFTSNRDGNHEIYVMNPDGTDQNRLTNVAGTDSDPSFSPDGTKIAFMSTRENASGDIYVMNADGTNQVRLAPMDFAPSFSPDSSKIVFASGRDGNGEIYVMNADGTNQTRLTNIGGHDLSPSFSPDGSKIAFVSTRNGGDEEVYLMNADGTNQTRLTSVVGSDFSPSFSPDGIRIAFWSTRDEISGSEIYVMNADGTNQTRLTNTSGFDLYTSWSGDLAMAPPDLYSITATNSSEGGITTLTGNIFSANPDLSFSLTVSWGDGSPQQVFNYPAGTTSLSETHQYLDDGVFTVSLVLTTANGSDSDSVIAAVNNVAPTLFVTNPLPVVIGSPLTLNGMVSDPGTLDAHTVHVNWGDGSPATILSLAAGVSNFSANHSYATLGRFNIGVQGEDDDTAPATPVNVFVGVVPPPTSGKIAFTSNFGGNNNIWLMNSNGTNQVALTNNLASDSYPNLSRDGSKIVFVSDRDGNPEIYVMNATGAFQTRLTNHTATESEPVFSPDGTKVVFASNRDGNHEVYIMNSDGTGQTRLTTNTVDDGQAEFSPNGTKIIFSRLAANQSDAHIYTMDLNGSNQVPLTSGSFVLNGQPSYSPNGQKIVFSRVSISHTNAEVYVMDANGANQTRLTTAAGQDMESVFSPDGSKIAFRSERDGNAEIYIMDADGTDQQRITFDGPGVSNFAPSWSDVSIVNVDIPDTLAAEQGATLTVPINVSDTTGKGILSYDFALNYDPAVLQPLPALYDKTGTLSANFNINAGSGSPGQVVVSGFGTAPLTGAGTLLYLKFNVIGTPPTSSDLTLNPFMFNEGIPFVEVSAGQVFVQGTIRGTVLYGTSPGTVGVPGVSLLAAGTPPASTTTAADGTYVLGGFGPGSYTVTPSKVGDNGGIAALDAALVSQFLVGMTPLTNNQQTAGEVSGNGTLTSFDAALIAQYVVSLPSPGSAGTWRFLPPSRFYASVANMTGENYTAILMGEVSGNWAPAPPLTTFKTVETTQLRPDRGPAVTATLPSIKASPEQLLTIPVSISFSRVVPAVQAYQFDVLYNPAVLQPEPTPIDTNGTLSLGLGAVTNTIEPGRLRLAVYGANPISISGTLINLKFRAIGRPGSNSALSFDRLMLNEGNPTVEGRNGKVTVRR